jgi:2-polyprenyl-3-methyl-5-hydroxy-6-metoxy-1,4-benzoquinol methylase
MDITAHWQQIYATKKPNEVSWYRPHLDLSLDLIGRAARDPDASIIDVGGGESTLVDDLLGRGYRDVTVLDLSANALEVARQRVEAHAVHATWIRGDVTTCPLDANAYDVWHDRAVFHFLTDAGARERYVQQVAHAVRRGGHVIVATFGPDAPPKCSGLDVVRYDASSLHGEFGSRFELVDHMTESHETPWGTIQQFVYCYCHVREGADDGA